jgi:opacity protein-like surface antigen
MSKTFSLGALFVAAFLFTPMAHAQDEPRPLSVDLAATYSVERANIVTNDCGCFWLQGGSVNGGVTFFHGLGVAANFTGEHSSNIVPGVDVNKLAFMAGPRYTLRASRWANHLHLRKPTAVFGEALFGFAHGFDGAFPTSTGFTSSASSFSMQVGGGLDVALAKRFGLRALEVDYVRTTLPNNATDTQNDLRLAVGISYRTR